MRTETATLEMLSSSITFAPFASTVDTQWSSGEGDGKARTYPTPFRATVSKAAPEEATTTPLTRHSDNRPTVGFIGAGALGTTLALALSAAGWNVEAVASRSYASALRLARLISGCSAESEPQAVVDRCRIVFLTVPDDVITQVVSSLDWPADLGVVHCSGAGTTELLSPAATAGALSGSFHPLQTFTSLLTDKDASVLAAVAQARLEGVTFAVEGSGWLRETLDAMASDLGGRTIEVEPADRPLYHASAVMSCGAHCRPAPLRRLPLAEDGRRRGDGISIHYPPCSGHPRERGSPWSRSGHHRPRSEGRRGHTAPTSGGLTSPCARGSSVIHRTDKSINPPDVRPRPEEAA